MTYRIDRSQFIENGPAVAADAAIARVRRAALRTMLEGTPKTDLKKAA